MNFIILSQIPTPAPGAIENWLLSFAAIASLVVLVKKLFPRKSPVETQFVTKTEFHHELTAIRDKIDARFLALSEKIEDLGTDRKSTRLNSSHGYISYAV